MVNDVFYKSQYGFREKHSTQNAVLKCPIQKSDYVRNFQSFSPKEDWPRNCLQSWLRQQGQCLSLDRKNYVKFLAVPIYSNLKRNHYINYVTLKISRIAGIIARLRHFVPTQTLLMIYRSLILPYLTYGLCAGCASKFLLKMFLILPSMPFHFLSNQWFHL